MYANYHDFQEDLDESNRVLDLQIERKVDEFLNQIDILFQQYGVDDFHKHNEFDFEFCMVRLRDSIEGKMVEDREFCFDP